jgi:hypothetical protein
MVGSVDDVVGPHPPVGLDSLPRARAAEKKSHRRYPSGRLPPG